MNRRRHYSGRILVASVLVLVLPSLALGELNVDEQKSDEGTLTVFKMTVTPAAEPVPALKHRLVLRPIDEQDGNAAPYYYRAIMYSVRKYDQLQKLFGEHADDYWHAEGVPIEKLRELARGEHLDLRRAATRPHCDWSWRLGDIVGPEARSFLISEAQNIRELSRQLIAHVRVLIFDRRYAEAIELLRINSKMGRDFANEPLLICGLVGLAIEGVGDRMMINFIAAPKSPNLYWALSELPDPVIDLRPAVRFEMSNRYRIYPLLKDAETQEHSPEEWARLLAKGFESLQSLAGTTEAPAFFNETTTQMGVTGLALLMYGPAKARLIAGGMDRARVEEMPVGQVMAVDAARELQRIGDEFEKSWYLPYAAARSRDNDSEDELGGNKFAGGFGKILAGMFLPALDAARTAQERVGWQLDGIRTVEAIRMHAAETGELPKSLDEIKVVPAPINRVTGKPYAYRLDGDTAVVDLPFSDGFPGVAWRFEITLAD
jgi:hypothetical protein